jgi:hypothetical protein
MMAELTPAEALAAAAQDKSAMERASKDLDNASEGARTATQSAILINGGAATAILAYLSKDTAPLLLNAASVALLIYAGGVFFAAVSMWCSSQASAQFGYYWGAVADRNESDKTRFWNSGQNWLRSHRGSFFLSIGCFIFASWWIASTFWKLHPAG